MKKCVIKGEFKIGSNSQGNTFIWWADGNKWLTLDEFNDCEIDDGAKFVLYMKDEIQHKVEHKHVAPDLPNSSHLPFNLNTTYSLSPIPLKLEEFKLNYETRQQPQSETIPSTDPVSTSLSDLFIGGAASVALALSVIQQVRQKKKEAEASVCCNNNKIEISKFDAKLQKLETEIKVKADKDNKGMIVEILEARKEIRDIKEQFEHDKEDIQKIIEIMTLNNKNKE